MMDLIRNATNADSQHAQSRHKTTTAPVTRPLQVQLIDTQRQILITKSSFLVFFSYDISMDEGTLKTQIP